MKFTVLQKSKKKYERTRRIWYRIFVYSKLEQEGIKGQRESGYVEYLMNI